MPAKVRTKKLVMAMVQQNGRTLEDVPDELRMDKELVELAVQ